MASDIDLCNRALIRLGSGVISSFNDGDKGTICSVAYPEVKQMLLTAHPWRFATAKRQLSKLSTTPTNEWTYMHQLPSDMLTGPWAVWNTTDTGVAPITNWERYGNQIYSDETVIVIDYRVSVDESYFPPWFQTLMSLAIAAAIAPAITANPNGGLAEHYHQLAFGTPSDNMEGGYFSKCKNINSQSHPNGWIGSTEITDDRFS
jgi:hypothetical protein